MSQDFGLDPDQDWHSVGSDLTPNCLHRLSNDNKSCRLPTLFKINFSFENIISQSVKWNALNPDLRVKQETPFLTYRLFHPDTKMTTKVAVFQHCSKLTFPSRTLSVRVSNGTLWILICELNKKPLSWLIDYSIQIQKVWMIISKGTELRFWNRTGMVLMSQDFLPSLWFNFIGPLIQPPDATINQYPA